MKKALLLLIVILTGVHSVSADDHIFFKKKSGEITMKPRTANDLFSFREPNDGLFAFTKTEGATASTETTISDGFEVKINSDKVKSFATDDLEVGIVYSWFDSIPRYGFDATMKTGNELKNYNFTVHGLDHGVTYFWRPYVRIFGDIYYGNTVDSITTAGETQQLKRKITLYAENPNAAPWDALNMLIVEFDRYNVGSCSDGNPGTYFAQCETKPKDTYTMDNYEWKDYDKKRFYNADDAAYVASGGKCRSINYDDLIYFIVYREKLKCSSETRIAPDGSEIKGILVKGEDYGGEVFFPSTGYYDGDSLKNTDDVYLWGLPINRGYDGHYYLHIDLEIGFDYTRISPHLGMPLRGIFSIDEKELFPKGGDDDE